MQLSNRIDLILTFIGFDFSESYITNGRYIPYLKETSSQWSLQIKFVEPKDAGLYECQIVRISKIIW